MTLQSRDRATARSRRGRAPVEELVVNVGPSHPSTHGVGRVDRAPRRRRRGQGRAGHRLPAPRHREDGREPHVPAGRPADRPARLRRARMYANWAYCRAVERLAGIRVPERAEYLRVIVCELQRIASHMMGIGCVGCRHRRVHDVHLRVRRARAHHRAVRGAVRRAAHLQLRAPGGVSLRRAGGLDRRRAGRSRQALAPSLDEMDHLFFGNTIATRPPEGHRRARPPRTPSRGARPARPRAAAA